MASPPRVRAALAAVAAGILAAGTSFPRAGWLGTAAAEEPPAPAPPAPPSAAPQQPPPPPPRPAAQAPQKARPAPAVRPKRAVAPKGKRVREVLPPAGTPIASFPGFARLEDGKSRIFVEVSNKVEVVENHQPGRLAYRLRGAAVVQRTNQMALVTGFFSTPVNRVQLVQMGPDVDVVIELREATTPTHLVTETPRGMVLWIDFPRSVDFFRPGEGYRDDGSAQPARPRATRPRGSRKLGGHAADEGAAPVDD